MNVAWWLKPGPHETPAMDRLGRCLCGRVKLCTGRHEVLLEGRPHGPYLCRRS